MDRLINKINFLINSNRIRDATYFLESLIILEPELLNEKLLLAELYISLKEVNFRKRACEILEDLLNVRNITDRKIILYLFEIYMAIGPSTKLIEHENKYGHILKDKQSLIVKNFLNSVVVGKKNYKFPEKISDFNNIKNIIDNYLSYQLLKNKIQDPKIFTFGSCFSRNIARRLIEKKISACDFFIGEEINTTFANLELIKFLLNLDSEISRDYFNDIYNERIDLNELRESLKESNIFIFTAGLSGSFYNKSTNQYIIHSNSNIKHLLKDKNLIYKLSSVSDNVKNLTSIFNLLKNETNLSSIFLTVSPVPLLRDLTENSAIISDTESKSILRAAVGEFCRENDDVIYFPSFEIFRSIPCFADKSAFGKEDGSSRHPNQEYIDLIVDKFINLYL